MFSIGSHEARYSFITKVVYLPPVKLGVVLLTQSKRLAQVEKIELASVFLRGQGDFERKSSFFKARIVQRYDES